LQGHVQLAEADLADCLAALHRPQPRVELGLALRGVASAAIDVSDGLLADLGHILEASGTAASLRLSLPEDELRRHCLLAGGDDYELAFTAPAARHDEVAALSDRLGLALTPIGAVVGGEAGAIDLRDGDGRPVEAAYRGYDHFA
jgi:thiamine-monophosphate kinase